LPHVARKQTELQLICRACRHIHLGQTRLRSIATRGCLTDIGSVWPITRKFSFEEHGPRVCWSCLLPLAVMFCSGEAIIAPSCADQLVTVSDQAMA
jgi:hypothetical protein